MTREQFEHAIRAAGAILGSNEVLVIGSQALHASVATEFPESALRSVEVDLAVLGDDGSKADLIDGSIGEASMFHETFGYYAQGVTEQTAILPPGWRDRLVRFESPATQGVVALCLEPHDLWLAKAVANREKDIEFCCALLEGGIVQESDLLRRLESMQDLEEATAGLVRRRIAGAAI
ncbi:MAG: hypothetical protein DWQ36_07050 [Acidobacteria bacterium]|nr:MAG: hypothetical protein DWQ30_24485 [Acidobacteriota bacterium]REK09299.1 MAG: hypothetical protein DWQ36_07050 [Acidobacteriota bacterium]